MSEGSFWPKTWKEAIPLLVWGVLIFAFGFMGVEGIGDRDLWKIVVGFGGMVGLTAMLISWTRIKENFSDLRWLIAAAMFAAIVVVFSPFVASFKLPFIAPSGPIVWNFEDNAKGLGYFLNMMETQGRGLRVLGFQAHGKNITDEPI